GGGTRAGVGAATGGVTGVLSPEEFRQTQDDCLPAVLADLTIRPRLPLKPQLQNQMFVGGGERAMLPREFQLGAGATVSSAIAVDWDKLREISARRFPGFGKPIPSELASSDKDLISILGGGERVAEMALRQTVHLAVASTPDGQRSAGTGVGSSSHTDGNGRLPPPEGICARLESETAGLGFGGSLLHFLRLGSVSSLSVVQARIHRRLAALFERVHCSGAEGNHVEDLASKLCDPRRRLLDEVLRREYTLYRARFFHRGLGRALHSSVVPGPTTPGGSSLVAAKRHEGRGEGGWMGIVPAWVWEELRKGQLDARKKQHNPEEMRLAGSTEPSSVHDRVFSAIQVKSNAPAWATYLVHDGSWFRFVCSCFTRPFSFPELPKTRAHACRYILIQREHTSSCLPLRFARRSGRPLQTLIYLCIPPEEALVEAWRVSPTASITLPPSPSA
ncbi:unnamed protein product, partial [Ectocarpus sp. 8 AP-2014]